jgi:hypothetical protein
MIASPNNRDGSLHALKFEAINAQTANQKSALMILAIMRRPVCCEHGDASGGYRRSGPPGLREPLRGPFRRSSSNSIVSFDLWARPRVGMGRDGMKRHGITSRIASSMRSISAGVNNLVRPARAKKGLPSLSPGCAWSQSRNQRSLFRSAAAASWMVRRAITRPFEGRSRELAKCLWSVFPRYFSGADPRRAVIGGLKGLGVSFAFRPRHRTVP